MPIRSFAEEYDAYKIKHPQIKPTTVSADKIDEINRFVETVVRRKASELHHRFDNRNERVRFYTGTLGETALEIVLKKPFVDMTIGDSRDYHVPDLQYIGIKAGIKTVEAGKFPIIFKRSYSPEIIAIKLSENTVHILGLATLDVLNKYQSDELVLSPELRRRGTKTAFHGLSECKPFANYEQLRELLGQ